MRAQFFEEIFLCDYKRTKTDKVCDNVDVDTDLYIVSKKRVFYAIPLRKVNSFMHNFVDLRK